MPPPDDPWTSRADASAPPPGTGPGRRGRAWPVVLGLVSALVLTGVVATAVVLLGRTTGRATTPAPASTTSSTRPVPAPASLPAATASTDPSTPSASPTAGPQEPLPNPTAPPSTPAPSGPDRSLRTNTLYTIDLGKAAVRCDLTVRRPKPPLANSKLQPYLTQVVRCLTSVFKGPLDAHGFDLVEPKIKTYHRKIDSPCGDFDQQGSPAYYCSSTATIYWPDTVDDGREAYTFARLGYVGLVAHEFGHHLQMTTGMLNAYADAYRESSTKAGYALSRRLELQAQCFEGVFLHATRAALDVSSADRRELKAWHSYTGDEDPPKDRKPDHGSSKAQYGWLVRGLDSGDFGSCNTWTASSRSVL